MLLLLLVCSSICAQNPAVAVNAASYAVGPIAPGSLASVFGDFRPATSADAKDLPLPRELGGVQVLVGGVAAPLLAVRETQINFQVPRELPEGNASLRVTNGAGLIAEGTLTISATAPALFSCSLTDIAWPGAVLNQDSGVNNDTARARPGDIVQIFATGEGPVDGSVGDGAAPPFAPLVNATGGTRVIVGMQEAEVLFSGLSPQFPGLWQINARVPLTGSLSGQVPVFVIRRSSASNGVTIWIAPN